MIKNINLKALRKNMKVSQHEIAEYLKVSRPAYSQYETGRREMNYETLFLLANFYNVSIDYLLGRSEINPTLLNKSVNKEEAYLIELYRLLDERGKEFSSLQFADYIEKKTHTVNKKLVFVIGGPYGFSKKIYEIASEKISLSKMTFSHQMIRLIFMEQLYRAMTILNNEPYHHE